MYLGLATALAVWYNRFVTDYLQDPKWGCYENFDIEWFSKNKW